MANMLNKLILDESQLLKWIQFCWMLQSLKELTRQGSAAAGFNRGDSDTIAAHTGSVGIISLFLALELKANDKLSINPSHVASIALLHDLNSTILGDVNFEVKERYFLGYQEGERRAFQDLVEGLQGAGKLINLYDEYKTQHTTVANIVRFANGLDGWLEVVPRASLAWMEQHKDYRDWIYNYLKGDKKYDDSLAKMYWQVCDALYENSIPPKRPGALKQHNIPEYITKKLDGLILEKGQLAEWLEVCQTLQRLKRLTRQGFITSGGFNRWDTDSIADHIGLVALISFTLAVELKECNQVDIDPYHVTALALVHDLGESILGDVNSEGKKRYYENYSASEKKAFSDLVGNLLCGDQLIAWFDEFEACSTTEAKIVRFADSLDAWMHVVPRSQQTWMPQHIEYRNRTFEKLRGDRLFNDALGELFLRTCLLVQGQPIGPKRPIQKEEKLSPSPNVSRTTLDSIAYHLERLQIRRQDLKAALKKQALNNSDDSEAIKKQVDTIQAELANATQTLVYLKERLSNESEKEDIL